MRKYNHSEVRARLKAEGVWGDFLLRRDSLRRQGLKPRDAFKVALSEFPVGSSPSPAAGVFPPVSSVPSLPSEASLEPFDSVEEVAREPEIVSHPGDIKPESVSGVSGGAPSMPPDDVGVVDIDSSHSAQADSGGGSPFRALGGRESWTAIAWVGEQIGNSSVVRADAPTPLAFELWDWVRTNAGTRSEFWKHIWPKTFPSTKMMEERVKLRDSHDTNEELLSRFLKGAREYAEDNLDDLIAGVRAMADRWEAGLT